MKNSGKEEAGTVKMEGTNLIGGADAETEARFDHRL